MPGVFDPSAVQSIGRFPVHRFIAEGGMAWVFEVEDPKLFGARRALKLLKPQAAVGEEIQRFMDEVRILATVEHPNLVRVYELGQDEVTGCHFYTMELVQGPDLSQIQPQWLSDPEATLLEGRLSTLEELCEHFLGVLSALSMVHARNIFHRDIKPQNIALSAHGIAKLADFGIAKESGSSGVTQQGLVPGTPLYMSPEQSLGDPVRAPSDLFSLGLTMYRVLTGRTVYQVALGSDTTTQVVLRHLWTLHGSRRDFEFEFPETVPGRLREVIRRACRMDLEERYPDAEAMREALARALAGEPAGLPGERRPGGLPGWMKWAAAGLAGVLLLGGGGFYLVKQRQDERRRAAVEVVREAAVASRAQLEETIAWLQQSDEVGTAPLVKVIRAELSTADEDLADGGQDLQDRLWERAARGFERSEADYAALCNRISNEYLAAVVEKRVGNALDALGGIPEAAAQRVPEAYQGLQTAGAQLDSELPPAGCDRAAGLRARVGTAQQVVEQAREVTRQLSEYWPTMVADRLGAAAAAKLAAEQGGVKLAAYADEMRDAQAQLDLARRAQGRKQWEQANASAELATAGFQRAASVGPADRAKKAAEELVQQAERSEITIGALRSPYDAGLRAFETAQWSEADQVLSELVPQLEGLLQEAAPAIEASTEARRARSSAMAAGLPEQSLAESDLGLEDAHRKFQAGRFAASAELYRELAKAFSGLEAGRELELQLAEERRQRDLELEEQQRLEEEQRLQEEIARKERERLLAATTQQQELAAEQRRLEEERTRVAQENEQRRREAEQGERQKKLATAAETRARGQLKQLAESELPTQSFERELETARLALNEGRWEQSEQDLDSLANQMEAFARESSAVLAAREQARTERAGARADGVPDQELDRAGELLAAADRELQEGRLDAATSGFASAREELQRVRALRRSRHEELAQEERERQRLARIEADQRAAELRKLKGGADASQRDARELVSSLEGKGLTLGALRTSYDGAQQTYREERYAEAERAFREVAEGARQRLKAAAPALESRTQAQLARDRAVKRGARGQKLERAEGVLRSAGKDLQASRFTEAAEGFRSAVSAFDNAGPDPKELIARVMEDWNRAWNQRDLELLQTTQQLSDKQRQGYDRYFKSYDEIRQQLANVRIERTSKSSFEVRFEYSRMTRKGASEKSQPNQTRRAEVSQIEGAWVITELDKP